MVEGVWLLAVANLKLSKANCCALFLRKVKSEPPLHVFPMDSFKRENVRRVFFFLPHWTNSLVVHTVYNDLILGAPWSYTAWWTAALESCVVSGWRIPVDVVVLWGQAAALIIQPETAVVPRRIAAQSHKGNYSNTGARMKWFQHLWITHGPRSTNNAQAALPLTQNHSREPFTTTHGLSRCE